MKAILITCVMLFFASHMTIAQKGRTIAKVTFPPKLSLKGTDLYFNGCGLREKYTLNLYVAALYLKNASMDSKMVINDNRAQAIKIVIISSKCHKKYETPKAIIA